MGCRRLHVFRQGFVKSIVTIYSIGFALFIQVKDFAGQSAINGCVVDDQRINTGKNGMQGEMQIRIGFQPKL